MSQKRITILGATGSIGASALDVVARHPDRYRVVGMTAGRNGAALEELTRIFRPEVVALDDPAAAAGLRRTLGADGPEVLEGPAGIADVAAAPADLVVAAIVGGAGLAPVFAAVRAGRDLALANKEAMVMAGSLLTGEAARHGVRIFPVDSEHSAIFQCLEGNRREDLDHVVLTASGGPFRTLPAERLERVTPEQAVRHPNWDMGAKITVDSATLMNKGLEVIEARWLFDLAPEQIRVLVHPQSIIHSMVAYRDGSVLAQLGVPDMRTPIACAMAWPERIPVGVEAPDLAKLGALTFEPPDTTRFPCLELAYRATAAGGTLPAALNAANEVAVDAFLTGRLRFTDIPRVIGQVMDGHDTRPLESLEQVLAVDAEARGAAAARIAGTAAAAGEGPGR